LAAADSAPTLFPLYDRLKPVRKFPTRIAVVQFGSDPQAICTMAIST